MLEAAHHGLLARLGEEEAQAGGRGPRGRARRGWALARWALRLGLGRPRELGWALADRGPRGLRPSSSRARTDRETGAAVEVHAGDGEARGRRRGGSGKGEAGRGRIRQRRVHSRRRTAVGTSLQGRGGSRARVVAAMAEFLRERE